MLLGLSSPTAYVNEPIAPGSIMSVYGTGLSKVPRAAREFPLPTSLGGTRVLLDGVAVPLFYVSPGLIQLQAPWNLTPGSLSWLQVEDGGVLSAPQPVVIVPAAPGLFALNGRGDGRATAVRPDTSYVVDPVHRGDVVRFYATGLGAVSSVQITGDAANGDWAALQLKTTPQVTIGGVTAEVVECGLAVGAPGLYQMDVRIPGGVGLGTDLPVSVVAEGTSSNIVTITVD